MRDFAPSNALAASDCLALHYSLHCTQFVTVIASLASIEVSTHRWQQWRRADCSLPQRCLANCSSISSANGSSTSKMPTVELIEIAHGHKKHKNAQRDTITAGNEAAFSGSSINSGDAANEPLSSLSTTQSAIKHSGERCTAQQSKATNRTCERRT
jgi:hypothetical protein